MKSFYNAIFVVVMLTATYVSSSFMGTVKGIGHGFESFGKTIGSSSFWKGIGRGFGAAPSGYVYSFTVDNDSNQSLKVGMQEYASFMGAYFPKSHGWSETTVKPFQQDYSIKQKEYYFEMKIMPDDASGGGGMPYSSDGALYVQDCIQLPKDQHSPKMNYFHAYTGKTFKDGNYKHQPMVEYMGYANPTNPKDKGASVTKVDTLTNNPALVVYNSTNQNLLIGYSSQLGAKSLKKSECDIFLTPVVDNSFITHSPVTVKQAFDIKTLYGGAKPAAAVSSLPLGTLGVFEDGSDEAIQIYALPPKVYSGHTYTLEVYQDVGQQRQIGLQALQSAHDAPSGKVRDITPVTCVFWYESVKQLGKKSKGMVDLPGNVWVVGVTSKGAIKGVVPVGEALDFTFVRPEIGKETWFYFVYVDEKDKDKEELFIDKFMSGAIGRNVVEKYHQQSSKQFQQAQEELADIVTIQVGSKAKAPKVQVPESLLIAAIQGALNVHGGEIVDTDLGVSGFLLGADVFLASGVGANSKFYYQLSPSQKNGDTIIKSTVQNLYTMGVMKAPEGMPTPKSYSAQGKNESVASTESAKLDVTQTVPPTKKSLSKEKKSGKNRERTSL